MVDISDLDPFKKKSIIFGDNDDSYSFNKLKKYIVPDDNNDDGPNNTINLQSILARDKDDDDDHNGPIKYEIHNNNINLDKIAQYSVLGSIAGAGLAGLAGLASNRYVMDHNPTIKSAPTRVNWGGERSTGPNAYKPLTAEEVEQVVAAIQLVTDLPDNQQDQIADATKEIRYWVDGAVRTHFGATRHFNAIRCLNDPRTAIPAEVLRSVDVSGSDVQLAGEEFFHLNRFLPNFPDVADIQWWALYDGGSWGLDTWNTSGEHLDTGFNGWGDLVGSVMKVDGKVLNPQEMIAFYRTIKLRNEGQFMTEDQLNIMQQMLSALDTRGSYSRITNSQGHITAARFPRGNNRADTPLQMHWSEVLELAEDIGLLVPDRPSLTYQGKAMITPTNAKERLARQTSEINPEVRQIIVPTMFA